MVNAEPENGLSGPELLAVAYAPKAIRGEFRWLVLLDHRLRAVLERTSEPMIAQLRLAWWRDVLAKPADARPKGEPLLSKMESLGEGLAPLAAAMVDDFEGMIDEAGQPSLSGLFESYHALMDGDGDELAGAAILAEWANGVGEVRFPFGSGRLRPLSILAMAKRLERQDGRANGLRLSWHALTGR